MLLAGLVLCQRIPVTVEAHQGVLEAFALLDRIRDGGARRDDELAIEDARVVAQRAQGRDKSSLVGCCDGGFESEQYFLFESVSSSLR